MGRGLRVAFRRGSHSAGFVARALLHRILECAPKDQGRKDRGHAARNLVAFGLAACCAAPASSSDAEIAHKNAVAAYVKDFDRHVKRYIVEPCGDGNPGTAFYEVKLFPDGYIRQVTLKTPSRSKEWDKAVMQALADAQPFTLPYSDQLRTELMDLAWEFSPGKQLAVCK